MRRERNRKGERETAVSPKHLLKFMTSADLINDVSGKGIGGARLLLVQAQTDMDEVCGESCSIAIIHWVSECWA